MILLRDHRVFVRWRCDVVLRSETPSLVPVLFSCCSTAIPHANRRVLFVVHSLLLHGPLTLIKSKAKSIAPWAGSERGREADAALALVESARVEGAPLPSPGVPALRTRWSSLMRFNVPSTAFGCSKPKRMEHRIVTAASHRLASLLSFEGRTAA